MNGKKQTIEQFARPSGILPGPHLPNDKPRNGYGFDEYYHQLYAHQENITQAFESGAIGGESCAVLLRAIKESIADVKRAEQAAMEIEDGEWEKLYGQQDEGTPVGDVKPSEEIFRLERDFVDTPSQLHSGELTSL